MSDSLRETQIQTATARPSFPPRLDGPFKRLFDVCAALSGLVFLSPFFLIIAILLKHEGPGPIFYRGPRIGKDGKPFGILKFRTMREEQASYAGPCITARDDPRITPFGKFLRDTKLNELPQLWNVLIGEMSLVGPRPEDPEIAHTWPKEVRREVLSLRPGITSPASILYRDEEKMLNTSSVIDDYLKIVLPDKLRLDQLYVRNHRFLSDLDVIFWTLIVLLPRLRTHEIPAESLYNGVFNRFTNRYLTWFVMDSLVAFAAVGVVGVLWRTGGPLDLGLGYAVVLAAGMALLFSLVNSRLGLGRVWWRSARPSYVFDLALSSTVSTLIVAALNWLVPVMRLIPLGLVLNSGLLAFLGFVFIRYRERLLTRLASHWLSRRADQYGMGERLLIVGAGECGLLAHWLLKRSKLSSAFSVVGMVDDDPSKTGMMVAGHRVLGLTRRIPEIVGQQDVGVILFAIESIQPEEQRRILNLCRQTPARLVLVPDLMALFRERLSSADLPLPSGAPFKGDTPQGGNKGWGEASGEVRKEVELT